MKKTFLVVFVIFFGTVACQKQVSVSLPETVQFFDLDAVELLESPFEHAQDLDKQYLLVMDPDRLLAPFLRQAGLEPKAENYTNWENTGLDGHIGGHYVSALAMMYASTSDVEIKERLDYMIAELKRAQAANGNGYVGGIPESDRIWTEIKNGEIRAGGFSLNGGWVPLYNIHKIFAGLRDAYLFGESQTAKTMLIELTDWMIEVNKGLSEEQMQDMLRSEHGGLNETFADVAAITGEDKYLDLAQRFSHQLILEPLRAKEDKLTGLHANTQIPKVIGYQRIAELNGDTSLMGAARFFWKEVVEDRSVAIGGNSAYEHFHPEDDFSRMIQGTQGPETCNTYNMLRLTKMLYQQSVDADYMDYYERALYNHILSSQHPETGGLVYFTQMRPGHYRVYSQPETSFWCCVGSGIENHAKYGEMIYAHQADQLFVNLFIPSRLDWQAQGVELVQENNFPEEAVTNFTVNTDEEKTFTLHIRYPNWVEADRPAVKINGRPYRAFVQANGYVSIQRSWQPGDQIEIDLPMRLQAEPLPDGSNYVAFRYGPVVLAANLGTEGMPGLFADDSRGGHIAQGDIIPLRDIPVIVSPESEILNNLEPIEDKPLHFKLGGLYSEDYTDGLELMPFYQLHEARYAIYLPQANETELAAMQSEMEAQEAAARALNSITADVVNTGEQQPESDHFIDQEDTWTGYMYEKHWREGPGHFSYIMQNEEQQARYLYLETLDVDRARACEVWVNGQRLGELELDGDTEGNVFRTTWELPAGLLNEKALQVDIRAYNKRWMSKITEVRLLKDLPG